MIIRAETVADYAAIADVQARAFGHRPGEALIVALHRQRGVFDADLSLVAETDGRVVGHALFSPHRVRLLGHDVAAVNLAPLAVAPSHQRRGIGGELIAEGHRIAAAKGYAISFLLGHPDYYPRFGYRTHAYGSAAVTIAADRWEGESLERRDVAPDDGPALRALWRRDEAAVDFALDPGDRLLDWVSPHPAMRSTVYVDGGEVVGYTRLHDADPTRPRVFLARDGAVARAMAGVIGREHGVDGLVAPIHPAAMARAGLAGGVCEAWAAAMARGLAPSPLDDYCGEVQARRRPPGRPTWPVTFDLSS